MNISNELWKQIKYIWGTTSICFKNQNHRFEAGTRLKTSQWQPLQLASQVGRCLCPPGFRWIKEEIIFFDIFCAVLHVTRTKNNPIDVRTCRKSKWQWLTERRRLISLSTGSDGRNPDIFVAKSISFRQLALEQRWTELYEEVKQMKVQKTNKIFDEKRNHKVHPSRQHVVQLTWSQSWLLESLAAWPMFTRCVDYTVLITWYWLLITSIDFTYFLTFRKKNLKIIQNKKLIEPLKGLFGVHDGWKRLHQD